MNISLKMLINRTILGFFALISVFSLQAAEKKEYKHITATIQLTLPKDTADLFASLMGRFRKKLENQKVPVLTGGFHVTLASFSVDSTGLSGERVVDLTNIFMKNLKEITDRHVNNLVGTQLEFSRSEDGDLFSILTGGQHNYDPALQFIAVNFKDTSGRLESFRDTIIQEFVQAFAKDCSDCCLWGSGKFRPHVSLLKIPWTASGKTKKFLVPSDGTIVYVALPIDELSQKDLNERYEDIQSKLGGVAKAHFRSQISELTHLKIPILPESIMLRVGYIRDKKEHIESDGWVLGKQLLTCKTSKKDKEEVTVVDAAAAVAATPTVSPAPPSSVSVAATKSVSIPAAKGAVKTGIIHFSREPGTPYFAFSLAYDGAPGADPLIPEGIKGYDPKTGLNLVYEDNGPFKNSYELYKAYVDIHGHDDAMKAALAIKFQSYPELRDLLLSTDGLPLRNMTSDKIWGWADGTGQNKLGKFLMIARGNSQKHYPSLVATSVPAAAYVAPVPAAPAEEVREPEVPSPVAPPVVSPAPPSSVSVAATKSVSVPAVKGAVKAGVWTPIHEAIMDEMLSLHSRQIPQAVKNIQAIFRQNPLLDVTARNEYGDNLMDLLDTWIPEQPELKILFQGGKVVPETSPAAAKTSAPTTTLPPLPPLPKPKTVSSSALLPLPPLPPATSRVSSSTLPLPPLPAAAVPVAAVKAPSVAPAKGAVKAGAWTDAHAVVAQLIRDWQKSGNLENFKDAADDIQRGSIDLAAQEPKTNQTLAEIANQVYINAMMNGRESALDGSTRWASLRAALGMK